MVPWDTPEAIRQALVISGRLTLVYLGVYAWDFVLSLWFEWWLLRRKIPFRWAYVPYFVGRYALLVLLILSAINSRSARPSDRESCITFGLAIPILGNLCMGCASLNLLIRTVSTIRPAPWYRWVIGPLLALAVGHWAVLIFGVAIAQGWSITSTPAGVICHAERIEDIAVIYLYTIVYDTLELTLSLSMLLKMRRSDRSLPRTLLKQGMGYFAVAFVANAIPAVLLLAAPSPVVAIIFIVPSQASSIMASSRLVTQLIAWGHDRETTSSGPSTPRPELAIRSSMQLTSQLEILAGLGGTPDARYSWRQPNMIRRASVPIAPSEEDRYRPTHKAEELSLEIVPAPPHTLRPLSMTLSLLTSTSPSSSPSLAIGPSPSGPARLHPPPSADPAFPRGASLDRRGGSIGDG